MSPLITFFLYAPVVGFLVLLVAAVNQEVVRKRREAKTLDEALTAVVVKLDLNHERVGWPEHQPSSPLQAPLDEFFPNNCAITNAVTRAIWGKYRGLDVLSFTYAYSPIGAKGARSEYRVYATRLALSLPRTSFHGSCLGWYSPNAFPGRHIRFESEEFNREYKVDSTDESFAYSLMHPQMIEHLLSILQMNWHLSGNYVMIAVFDPGDFSKEQTRFDALIDFAGLIPDFIMEDHKVPVTWTNVWD